MAKMKKGRSGGHSGLTRPSEMDPGTGPGQDGFNLPSHVTSYNEGTCSDDEVGHEEPSLVDSRYGGGKGKRGKY